MSGGPAWSERREASDKNALSLDRIFASPVPICIQRVPNRTPVTPSTRTRMTSLHLERLEFSGLLGDLTAGQIAVTVQ